MSGLTFCSECRLRDDDFVSLCAACRARVDEAIAEIKSEKGVWDAIPGRAPDPLPPERDPWSYEPHPIEEKST